MLNTCYVEPSRRLRTDAVDVLLKLAAPLRVAITAAVAGRQQLSVEVRQLRVLSHHFGRLCSDVLTIIILDFHQSFCYRFDAGGAWNS